MFILVSVASSSLECMECRWIGAGQTRTDEVAFAETDLGKKDDGVP